MDGFEAVFENLEDDFRVSSFQLDFDHGGLGALSVNDRGPGGVPQSLERFPIERNRSIDQNALYLIQLDQIAL
ncbi:hypothetical protein Ms3S1_09040 [Methylosinus sp. 3S-1]